jgi:hypothetical protein
MISSSPSLTRSSVEPFGVSRCGDRRDGQSRDLEAPTVVHVDDIRGRPVGDEWREHRGELGAERRSRIVEPVPVGGAEVDGHVPACEHVGQAQDVIGMTVGEEDRLRVQFLLGQEALETGCAVVSGVDEDAVAAALGSHGIAVDVEEFGVGCEYIHVQSLSGSVLMVMLG